MDGASVFGRFFYDFAVSQWPNEQPRRKRADFPVRLDLTPSGGHKDKREI
jgi:hypothetical protein